MSKFLLYIHTLNSNVKKINTASLNKTAIMLTKETNNEKETDCHMLHRGVVVITTAQLHSTKPEIRFCAASNPAGGVSKICDGEAF